MNKETNEKYWKNGIFYDCEERRRVSWVEVVMVMRQILIVFLFAGFLFSCGGKFSKKAPIHPNLNMDNQPKMKSQTLSLLLPVGVVPYGANTNPFSKTRLVYTRPHVPFFYGVSFKKNMEMTPEIVQEIKKVLMDKNNPSKNKVIDGVRFVNRIPFGVNKTFIIRGFRKFQTYCAMCHGLRGLGNGLIVERRVGIPPPPNFASKDSMALSDGKIFNVITYGRPENGMPAHAAQLVELDRWAIVAYIRTLQRAMNGKEKDIPKKNRE